MVIFAVGKHFQRRLGLGLNVENPFDGGKRERPVAAKCFSEQHSYSYRQKLPFDPNLALAGPAVPS